MIGLVAETVALVATAVFAGAAAYVSLVEHPARQQCTVAVALAEFGPSYRRRRARNPARQPVISSGLIQGGTR